MPQKPQYLQLEMTDDVASVRDRLAFLRGQRVLLIWPEDGSVLNRKLDLVLVQREAMRQLVRLALVTHDPQVIQHARELNISTFETIGASERARWRRGRSKVFTSRWQRPEDMPEAELMPVASRVRGEGAPVNRVLRLAARVIVVGLLLGVMLASAYLLLPSATVTLTPASEEVRVEASIIADPNAADVDIGNRIIPATILRVDQIEESGTLPTTGVQDLADLTASGTVVFINRTDDTIDIPSGTVVGTSAGTPILFQTTEAASAPAEVGGQIEVPVEAVVESAGDVGNVDTGLINTVVGELAEVLTVRNLTPTTGGASRALKAVSADDRDRLLATLRQQLQSRAYVSMESQRSPTQHIILETIRITQERDDWKTWSAQPGEVADVLSLTMRADIQATAIDQQFAQQIAFSMLAAQIPSGRIIRPESVQYTCCAVQGVDSGGRVGFVITGSGRVVEPVNSAGLQERLAGQTVEEAVQIIGREVDLAGSTPPQIRLTPDWLGRMPLLPFRIGIRVVEETSP